MDLVNYVTKIVVLLLASTLYRLKSARGHLGEDGMWEPNLDDPFSNVQAYCENATLTCSQWKENTDVNRESCCNHCKCDEDCLVRQDCCADKKFKFNGTDHVTKQNEKCVTPEIHVEQNVYLENREQESYLLVTYDELDEKKSQLFTACMEPAELSISGNTPVYSPDTKLNYKNKYCALYNGVARYIPWELYLHCPLAPFAFETPFGEVIENDEIRHFVCSVYWKPNNPSYVKGKACPSYHSHVQNCPSTMVTESLETLCTNYHKQLVRGKKSTYRNVFCMACNEHFTSLSTAKQTCMKPSHKPVTNDFHSLVNLDVILSKDKYAVLGDRTQCPKGSVYIWKMCHEVLCPFSYKPHNGRCQPIFPKMKGFGLSFRLKLSFPNGLNVTQSEALTLAQRFVSDATKPVCFSRVDREHTSAEFTEFFLQVTVNANDFIDFEKEHGKFLAKIQSHNANWGKGSKSFKIDRYVDLYDNYRGQSTFIHYKGFMVSAGTCHVPYAVTDLQFDHKIEFSSNTNLIKILAQGRIQIGGVVLEKDEYIVINDNQDIPVKLLASLNKISLRTAGYLWWQSSSRASRSEGGVVVFRFFFFCLSAYVHVLALILLHS